LTALPGPDYGGGRFAEALPMLVPTLARLLPLGLLSFAVGCSSTCEKNSCACQEACNRLYQESECNIIEVGNQTRDERILDCVQDCENALETPGEIREDYDPYEYTPQDEAVEFTNDKEAALWMECVAETSCELIADGYCAPLP
jgi:hypothetical protein